MTQQFTWILPEGIEAPGPDSSARHEHWRRALLDLYKSWGYMQVSPPMMEHAEYFRSDEDFTSNRRLFFLTDPLTGRQLAVRADATSQIARLRASALEAVPDPVRLCYCLPALQRHPESLGAPRFFYQVGLELFGGAGLDADAEVLELMCRSLQYMGGGSELIVSLGHTGFVTSLMDAAKVSEPDRPALLHLLQRRSVPELRTEARRLRLPPKYADLLCALGKAYGDISDLDSTLAAFASVAGSAEAAGQLRDLARCVEEFPDPVQVQFDLADTNGQLYHEGLVFACFTPQHGSAIARGGRYRALDGSMAVGFSSSLWLLASLGDRSALGEECILAPVVSADHASAAALRRKVAQLRAEGRRVVQMLSEGGGTVPAGCTRALRFDGGDWTLAPLEQAADQ